MKVNHYAVIPAQVRYDRTLSATSILLFGEVAAASNTYGICEEDNGYFSAALKVDSRTVTRCIGQLVDQGHIIRIKENGQRRLRIVTKGLDLPEEFQIEKSSKQEDISEYVDQLFHIWETKLGVKVDKKELYHDIVRARLNAFTKEDLIKAVQNRVNFVISSPWHMDGEGRQHGIDIEHVLGTDNKTLKWLNAKELPDNKQKLKAFKYN